MKVTSKQKCPPAVPKGSTIVGQCYSNKFPTDHLFIRVEGYSYGAQGFVNLSTGMFTPMDECRSPWYPVEAEVVTE